MTNQSIEKNGGVFPLATIIYDINSNLVDCEKDALNYFGYSDKQKFLNNFPKFIPPLQLNGFKSKNILENAIYTAINAGYCIIAKFWLESPKNGQVAYKLSFTRIRVKNDSYAIIHIHDIDSEN
ncbi:MAG: hypothetical protein FWC09_11095 [Lachnospiraceae bacterium]|nr:hypothetical protein [Lachnospiraceae bacterium]